MLNISHLIYRSFGSLSQGEQKLVLFARALIANPSIYIVDELGQGLDAQNREMVKEVLNGLVESPMFATKALLHITHHHDEKLDNYSRIITLEKGKIIC